MHNTIGVCQLNVLSKSNRRRRGLHKFSSTAVPQVCKRLRVLLRLTAQQRVRGGYYNPKDGTTKLYNFDFSKDTCQSSQMFVKAAGR